MTSHRHHVSHGGCHYSNTTTILQHETARGPPLSPASSQGLPTPSSDLLSQITSLPETTLLLVLSLFAIVLICTISEVRSLVAEHAVDGLSVHARASLGNSTITTEPLRDTTSLGAQIVSRLFPNATSSDSSTVERSGKGSNGSSSSTNATAAVPDSAAVGANSSVSKPLAGAGGHDARSDTRGNSTDALAGVASPSAAGSNASSVAGISTTFVEVADSSARTPTGSRPTAKRQRGRSPSVGGPTGAQSAVVRKRSAAREITTATAPHAIPGTSAPPDSAVTAGAETHNKAGSTVAAVSVNNGSGGGGGMIRAAFQMVPPQQHSASWFPRVQPCVIAHRGASGVLPEHTAEAYRHAIDQGADFIECDVVLTSDLQPICRHEPDLNATTNAGALFPTLVRTHRIDGRDVSGIFAADLTLQQVKQLRAVQPWPFRDQGFNGRFAVLTLTEYLDIALSANRTVGVYIETKHPAWHNGLPAALAAGAKKSGGEVTLEAIVLSALHHRGYGGAVNSARWLARPAFLQSFDVASLRTMARSTCLPLVLLVNGHPAVSIGPSISDLTSDRFLLDASSFVSAYGVNKEALVVWDAKQRRYSSSGLAERLHHHNLQVHAYTMRSESNFVLANLADVAAEAEVLFKTVGVDGAFVDHPEALRAALAALTSRGTVWNLTVMGHQRKCDVKEGG